jgi:hypothetical protein
VPEHARHQVRVECDVAPRHLTIVGRRAPWREDVGPEWISFPIARLRYTAADKPWTLYWPGRNLRFHTYRLLRLGARVTRWESATAVTGWSEPGSNTADGSQQKRERAAIAVLSRPDRRYCRLPRVDARAVPARPARQSRR